VHKLSYSITRDFIRFGKSRPGRTNSRIRFIVSHDTGNPGSTAYANRTYFDRSQPSASAHTFIDDKYILEIIPLNEIAYHVRYQIKLDNARFGDDANDAAIGVELCHGGKIQFEEAYKRYVWYHAYLCRKFNLNPDYHIISHATLDPTRRTDPINILRTHGITWDMFIDDVKDELEGNSIQKKTKAKATTDSPQVKGISISLPLKEGDSGSFVRDIQKQLLKSGIGLPLYGADGFFGEETELAVMRFQRTYKLLVDGLVGPQTIKKLEEITKKKTETSDFPLPTNVLQKGDKGEAVKQLQRALKEVQFDPKFIDGIYGELTEDAVLRFQSMYQALLDDGIYGPKTRKFLNLELSE